MNCKNGFEDKKLALLRIKQIFEKYSDFDHPLSQNDVIEHLEKDYGIILERKAVGRNIALLNLAAEHDNTPSIVTEKGRGAYLESRDFTDAELRMLIDSVLSSKHISPEYSKEIIEKLCGLSNRHFRSNVRHIYSVNDWSKTQNKEFFYNIEIIDEAIENEKQISFKYKLYGPDKCSHTRARHRVSPYQLILHNQRYYLMAYDEYMKNMVHYRLDRIFEMKISDKVQTPLRTIEGYRNGIDYKKFSSMPYMYSDTPVEITLLVEESVIDQVVDWLGFGIKIDETDKTGKLRITVTASPMAMEYWAMQYMNHVEVISPQSLRDKIRENILNAEKKYE